jgi:hypothetical protein
MSKASPKRKALPLVAAVVQPVAKRLSRIEALLVEMRHEQDVKLKRIAAIQLQLDALTDRRGRGARRSGAIRPTMH